MSKNSANFIFTSESVSEGHPDKVADQVSDAIVDAMIEQDPDSRVACETMIKTGMVAVAGETRSQSKINVEEIVRKTVADIGYDNEEVGFNQQTSRWVSMNREPMNRGLATKV